VLIPTIEHELVESNANSNNMPMENKAAGKEKERIPVTDSPHRRRVEPALLHLAAPTKVTELLFTSPAPPLPSVSSRGRRRRQRRSRQCGRASDAGAPASGSRSRRGCLPPFHSGLGGRKPHNGAIARLPWMMDKMKPEADRPIEELSTNPGDCSFGA
jgi:hypothetical protein